MILPKEKLWRWRRNDPRDWAKYKKLRNTINKNIKTSKASYYSNAFGQSEGNPRKTWQTINELTCRRTNNTTVKELKLNDSIISNFSDLSNAFYDHFSTIGHRLANDIRPNNNNNNMMSWNQRTTSRPYRRRGRGKESEVSPSGKEHVIAEVKFSISSNSLVSAVNHMAARTFRGKKNNNDKKRVFLSTKFLVSTFA